MLNDNITSIGPYAFARSSLNTITLGENVKTIGYAAFGECISLESVIFPKRQIRSLRKSICGRECWIFMF
jgi:hypothetical protein